MDSPSGPCKNQNTSTRRAVRNRVANLNSLLGKKRNARTTARTQFRFHELFLVPPDAVGKPIERRSRVVPVGVGVDTARQREFAYSVQKAVRRLTFNNLDECIVATRVYGVINEFDDNCFLNQ